MAEEKAITASDLAKILADQARQNEERTLQIIKALKEPTALEQKKLDEEALEHQQKQEERKQQAPGKHLH